MELVLKNNYYARYEGSLTDVSSSCSENVTWIVVLSKFTNLSKLQLGDLKLLIKNKNNNRDV